MDMNAERFIPASVADTWAAINDPEVLKACIPGCDVFDRVGDDGYSMQMLAKVGPVSARFKGAVKLQDMQPPQACTLTFEGQGGVAGFAKGSAQVNLSAHTQDGVEGTLLRYTANADVGGKLAQIGSRLIDSAARKTADDFFDRFLARFAPAGAAGDGEPAKAGLWARTKGLFGGAKDDAS